MRVLRNEIDAKFRSDQNVGRPDRSRTEPAQRRCLGMPDDLYCPVFGCSSVIRREVGAIYCDLGCLDGVDTSGSNEHVHVDAIAQAGNVQSPTTLPNNFADKGYRMTVRGVTANSDEIPILYQGNGL
jgi:hypothetical protein